MKKNKPWIISPQLLVFLTLCLLAGPFVFVSSNRAQLTAWNKEAHVTLYNGGKAIREWDSVGKVATEEGSDGWYFQDKATLKLVRVSGPVVVELK